MFDPKHEVRHPLDLVDDQKGWVADEGRRVRRRGIAHWTLIEVANLGV